MPHRPLGVAAIAAGLLAVGLVPLLGVANAAACPTWSDPEGDATLQEFGVAPTGDPSLDILQTTWKTVGSDVAVTIRTAGLGASPSRHGDQFSAQLSVAGQTLLFYANRTVALGTTAGIDNPGAGASGAATAVFDAATKSVTITAKQAEVDKAATKPTKGQSATKLASSATMYTATKPLPSYDGSLAPKELDYVVGAACTGGGGGPVPSPSGSPTATPTSAPTASPTATPTATPTVSPTTPPGLPAGYPKAGCNTFTDAKGDGTPDVPHPLGGAAVAEAPNDVDLDITGVVLGSTDTDLLVFVRVDDLKALPSTGNGHSFEVAFTHAGKSITLYATQYDAAMTAARGGLSAAQTPAPSSGGRMSGSYNAGLKVTSVFDVTNNVVVFKLTRDSLATVAVAPVPEGAALTAITASSRVVVGPATTAVLADSAPATGGFTVGDSPCFAPPAAVLANTGSTTAQYTDAATVAAKLTDAAGAALAGKPVTFKIGSVTVSATTGGDGVAEASLKPGAVAGSYSLVTSFAGDDTASKVSLTTPFAVTVEKTKLVLTVAKSGTKRTVTAKLLDDDGKPVAGQSVVWHVNARKVSTAKTNASGVVTFTGATATQTVKAVYAAVTGKYAGVTAQVKV